MARFQKGNPGGPGRPKGAKTVKTIKDYVRSNEIDVGKVWFESIMQIDDAHKRHSGSKQVQQSSEFEQSIKDKLAEFESKLSDNESNVAAAMLKVGLK